MSYWMHLFNTQEGNDNGYGICESSTGDLYITGSRLGTNQELFLSKLTPAGREVWRRQVKASSVGYGVAMNASGRISVVGEMTNGSYQDNFIANFLPNGDLEWQERYSFGAGHGANYSIACTAGGDTYLAGKGWSANADVIVSKISSGVWQWHLKLSSSSVDNARGIVVGSTGDLYIVGSCTTAASDVMVAKISSGGSLLWCRKVSSPSGSDKGFGIAIDPSDNIYITGEAAGATIDSFIISYTSAGVLRWQKNYFTVTAKDDYGTSIVADASGVYITGSVTIGTYLVAWIAKYDHAGTWQWHRNINTGAATVGHCIRLAANGDLLWTGNGTISAGGVILVARLPANGNFIGAMGLYVTCSDMTPNTTDIGGMTLTDSAYTFTTVAQVPATVTTIAMTPSNHIDRWEAP